MLCAAGEASRFVGRLHRYLSLLSSAPVFRDECGHLSIRERRVEWAKLPQRAASIQKLCETRPPKLNDALTQIASWEKVSYATIGECYKLVLAAALKSKRVCATLEHTRQICSFAWVAASVCVPIFASIHTKMSFKYT
jgi:hypothetical protein